MLYLDGALRGLDLDGGKALLRRGVLIGDRLLFRKLLFERGKFRFLFAERGTQLFGLGTESLVLFAERVVARLKLVVGEKKVVIFDAVGAVFCCFFRCFFDVFNDVVAVETAEKTAAEFLISVTQLSASSFCTMEVRSAWSWPRKLGFFACIPITPYSSLSVCRRLSDS